LENLEVMERSEHARLGGQRPEDIGTVDDYVPEGVAPELVAAGALPKKRLRRGCKRCGAPKKSRDSVYCDGACKVLVTERTLWPSETDLARMLWEKPATLIAESLGVTSVSVKKHCRKLGIETPPRGYWAKLRAA